MLLRTFGARVRYLRRLWGLRQADIHKAGGPSRSTLSRIESDEEGPGDVSDATLQGLALSLKCNRQWLEEGRGRVWPEGITPPEGSNEDELLQASSGLASARHLVPRPDPEQGEYLSDGRVDMRIFERTVEIVMTLVTEAGGFSQDPNLHFAKAYQLVYRYLAKQEDPFDPIHISAASHIVTAVWD